MIWDFLFFICEIYFNLSIIQTILHNKYLHGLINLRSHIHMYNA
jgi:hypothetical protein